MERSTVMTLDKPRAYTEEEVRGMFLDHIRSLVDYWGSSNFKRTDTGLPHTQRDRLEGLAFSILSMLDGASIKLPAIDLSLSPHPSDKDYHKDQGENWFEPGMVINDCQLHELFYKK